MIGQSSPRPASTPTEVPMRLCKMSPDFKRIIGVQIREFIHEIDDLGEGADGFKIDTMTMFENNDKSMTRKKKRVS